MSSPPADDKEVVQEPVVRVDVAYDNNADSLYNEQGNPVII